jgi:predicted CXXCH cytochrome family protein
LKWALGLIALQVSAAYVGSQACKPCHPSEFDRQTGSHHAQALRPIAESLLREFAMDKIEWAFGAGAQGITPVGRLNGQYFENQLSYYSRLHGLATTFGHPEHPTSPIGKLGILQDNRTITHCFNCHATNVRPTAAGGPDLEAMQPGVQCERCHGPGSAHIAAPARGQLLNPGRLAPVAQAQVCGECHRVAGPDTGNEPELENPVNVRFAPIGLMASRCFRESKKLACTTCHDPHENARPRADASYNRVCRSCHTAGKSRAHVSTAGDCLGCHMKQASLSPYLRFTDHRIRVYSLGS